MKQTTYVLVFLLFVFAAEAQTKKKMLTYPRVREAYKEKEAGLKTQLQMLGVTLSNCELLLVGLKKDDELQAWVRNKGEKQYKYFKTYSFCSNSGELGPKRQMGDYQIPEGIYNISYFNPYSNFHLSLKVSYPNRSDRIRGKRGSLGGDIFIHGACVTIGCIPITDDLIKELFILAVEAHQSRKIDVLLLPTALNEKTLAALQKEFPFNDDAKTLWAELTPIYQFFLKNKHLPSTYVDKKGAYRMRK